MPNIGYSTLGVIPAARGYASALGTDIAPRLKSQGVAAVEAVGGDLLKVASRFALPAAVAVAIGATIRAGFRQALSADAGTAQLTAGIQSTGKAAGVTVPGLTALARNIQHYSGQTDDSIVASEKLLLTFTNIKNVGPDRIFDDATKATADMAARMGGDASGAAIQLGKALNDPIAGIASLSRMGIQFTDQQKDQIKAMVEAGDTLGAQKMILAEVNKEFGGSAAAMGESLPGKINILKRSFEDFAQTIVGSFTPVLGPAIDGLSNLLEGAATKIPGPIETIKSAVGGVFELLQRGGAVTPEQANLLGPFIPMIVSAGETVRSTLGGIMDAVRPFIPAIVAGFSGLVGPLLQVATSFSPFSIVLHALLPVLPQLAGMLAQLAAQIGPAIGDLLPLVLQNFRAVGDLFSNYLAVALPLDAQILGELHDGLLAAAPPLLALVAALLPLVAVLIQALSPLLDVLVKSVVPPVVQLLGFIVSAVAPVVSALADVMIPVIQALLPVVAEAFAIVAGAVQAGMQIVSGIIDVVLGVLSGDWSRVWKGLGEIVGGVWSAVVNIVTGAVALLGSILTAALNITRTSWTAAWGGVTSLLGGLWTKLVDSVSDALLGVGRFFLGLGDSILRSLAGAGTWLLDIGKNIVEGLIDGIRSMAIQIAKNLLSLAEVTVSTTRAALGIHSPSRVMYAAAEAWADEALSHGEVPPLPSVAVGVARAAANLASTRQRRPQRFRYDDHSTSGEDKVTKIQRAHLVLVASAGATSAAA